MSGAWWGRVLSGLAALAPGAAAPQGAGEGAGPTCSVAATTTGNVVDLRGLAESPRPARGRYRLVVTKSGPAGTSNISQGGEFAVEPAAPARVGQVSISVEPEGRYEAILTLVVDGRQIECRASGPDTRL